MQIFANPNRFFQIADRVTPFLWAATVIAFIAAVYFAFFNSPADYQQGETVRIMYVHVPSAWLAMAECPRCCTTTCVPLSLVA